MMVSEQDVIPVQVDADLADLFPDYLQKRQGEIGRLVELMDAADFNSIEGIAHRIRGNAALFGMEVLAEHATLLEQAAQRKDQGAIKTLAEVMRQYLSQVRLASPLE